MNETKYDMAPWNTKLITKVPIKASSIPSDTISVAAMIDRAAAVSFICLDSLLERVQ